MVNAHVGEKYIAVYAKNPVTVDGKWTSADEWSNATELQLVSSRGEASVVFRAMHDESNLYILIEFLSDATIDYTPPNTIPTADSQDFFRFYFEIGHKGSTSLTDDDCAIAPLWRDKDTIQVRQRCAFRDSWPLVGDINPPGFEVASTLDPTNSPYSSNHLIWEAKIPKKYVRGSATIYDFTSSTTLGFAILAFDAGKQASAIFPGEFSETKPSTWSDLELAPKP